MNFLISSDNVCEKASSANVSIDDLPTDEATTLTSVEHRKKQVTGDFLATDGDGDSIAEVEDGLTQIHLQRIDKLPVDTPDSLLSTSDTLSSYSGCSTGGVSEPFVAVFRGVQEVSQDDAWISVDDGSDDDSAVHICSVDGSLCGSVTSSHDQPDECVASVNATVSDAAGDKSVPKVKNNSLLWYCTRVCFLYFVKC